MDFNKKELIEKYDLGQVILGNFCENKYTNGYINEVTQQSFRLQCCLNFTNCDTFVVVNKKLKEVSIN